MESMSTKYFVKRLKSDVLPLNLSADGHPLCIYGNCHMPRHRFRCCWCNLFHELLHPRYLAPYLKILRVFKEYLLHNISYITPPLPQLYCTETILSSVQSYLIMNNRVRIQTVIKKNQKKIGSFMNPNVFGPGARVLQLHRESPFQAFRKHLFMSPSRRKIIYKQCTSIYLICYIPPSPSSHTLLRAKNIFE